MISPSRVRGRPPGRDSSHRFRHAACVHCTDPLHLRHGERREDDEDADGGVGVRVAPQSKLYRNHPLPERCNRAEKK